LKIGIIHLVFDIINSTKQTKEDAMGWSCRREASDTLNRLMAHHHNGVYEAGVEKYFLEPSRVEHKDGAVTGKVYKMRDQHPDGHGHCRAVGRFRIEPTGEVSKGPGHLKKLAALPMPTGRCRTCGDRTADGHTACWACEARMGMQTQRAVCCH
jgi:hypothetical protein